MHSWMRLWLDEDKRLATAKFFMKKRLEYTLESWDKLGLVIADSTIRKLESTVKNAASVMQILSAEGEFAKSLYGILAKRYRLNFSREAGKGASNSVSDKVNGFLDHGNYIAYGYAGVALYALGISYALAVLHGKTRRGALVFDVADLVKDALVMPMAFDMGAKGRVKDQEFRIALIEHMQTEGVTDRMIDTMKLTIQNLV
jgi:CRISPR-associated protein Cas1